MIVCLQLCTFSHDPFNYSCNQYNDRCASKKAPGKNEKPDGKSALAGAILGSINGTVFTVDTIGLFPLFGSIKSFINVEVVQDRLGKIQEIFALSVVE